MTDLPKIVYIKINTNWVNKKIIIKLSEKQKRRNNVRHEAFVIVKVMYEKSHKALAHLHHHY